MCEYKEVSSIVNGGKYVHGVAKQVTSSLSMSTIGAMILKTF